MPDVEILAESATHYRLRMIVVGLWSRAVTYPQSSSATRQI